MKLTLSFFILTLLVATVNTAEGQDIDADVQGISDFLLQIIEKYDVSGAGAIPLEKYPSFLYDVFITGNQISSTSSQVGEPVKQLLLQATTGFATKYNTTQVGIQQFYMDLVKDFTIYLTQHQEKYSPLIQIFFADTPSTAKQTENQEKGQQSVEL